MVEMLNKLIDVLVGIVIFVALFGVILTSINGFNWSAVNVSGKIYDFSWAPFVVVILLVVGFIYLGYKMVSHKGE